MDDPPPPSAWQRRSRRVAYENQWITVWHDDVVRPDGEPGIYGVVHFHGLAVGVVAIDDQDRVALVGQHRYSLDSYSWEIPEGGVPFPEDPLAGAKRELQEETGLVASSWQEIGRLHLSNSVTDEAAIAFLATGLTAGPASPDGTEQLVLRWVPFEEALAMAVDGRITDALSVMPLLRIGLTRLRDAAGTGAATINPTPPQAASRRGTAR
jgi:8-oxo-dGTP pyrophosphatase MutT (NUDIX family)